MTRGVTVITPSLPERAPMLAEAMASVAAQTFAPAAHLVGIDHGGRGPAFIRQELVEAAQTDWVAFLDDDDLLDPHHLHELWHHAFVCLADVVFSRCRFDGPPLPAKYCNQPYDREQLLDHGIFPITVLARREAILAAGGFRANDRYEDWALWNRMAENGAQFFDIPTITWTYRTGHAGRRTNAA